MRTSNINVRVEPDIARGLTWLTNKYNFEHKEALTKTDIIEGFVSAALKDEDVLDLVFCILGKNDLSSYEIYLEGGQQ